jgi:5'-nucleotidase
MQPNPILIDQDGVLADFVLGLYQELERRLAPADFAHMPDMNTAETFYVEDCINSGDPKYDIWLKNQVIHVVDTWEGMFRDIPPIPGAVEHVQLLQDLAAKHNIGVRICTAPHVEHKTCHSDKAAWAAKHLGDTWAKQMIMSHDKTVVRGLVLLDDKPKVTGSLEPMWEHVVFGAPCNRHTDRIRVDGWSEASVMTILNRALERNRE